MSRTLLHFLVLISAASAQRFDPSTRAAEIDAERDKKSKALAVDTPNAVERALMRVKDERVLERFSTGYYGLKTRLGGLVNGGGFAVGPEYFRPDLNDGNVLVRTSAQVSTRGFQKYDAQLGFPRLFNDHGFAEVYAVRHNYLSLPYYGPGPDSKKTGRTRYGFEDNAINATFGVRPVKQFTLGATLGYLAINTGPGKSEQYASASDTYSDRVTPGIDRQTSFFVPAAFVQIDTRDDPAGPRAGTNIVAQFSRFSDRDKKAYSFDRVDIEAQQYLPFWNKRRVIALRAKTSLSYPGANNRVPFYLQPVLGGSDDLRGFRPFRFYDDNMIVANLEYRWEVFAGMDMATFWDVGKVTPKRSQINFHNMESSVGIGMRFNARNRTWLRVDAGFSHEGFQVWFKFTDIFTMRQFGSASTQTIY